LSKIYAWAEKFEVDLLCKVKDGSFNQKVLDLVKERMKLLSDFNDSTQYFYIVPSVPFDMLVKYAEKDKTLAILEGLSSLYEGVANWTSTDIDTLSHEFASREGHSPKEAFMTLRVAVTGNTATPPIFDVCAVLGKEEVLARIQMAVNTLKSI
jgi:glutamyl-tRNA synthetase